MSRLPKRRARRCESPCPGCKATGKYRFKDEVCNDCKALFAEVEAYRAELKRLLTDPAIIAVDTPEPNRPHDLPYIHMCGSDNCDELHRAMLALVHGAGVSIGFRAPSEWGESYYQRIGVEVDAVKVVSGQKGGDHALLLQRSVHEAFKRLYSAIESAVTHAYREGHEEGRDLLMSLHAGDITLAEMEERVGIAQRTTAADSARRER